MGLVYAILIIFACVFSFLIIAMTIRYAIDSSRTSRHIASLLQEVQSLRADLRKQNEQTHIIDKRV